MEEGTVKDNLEIELGSFDAAAKLTQKCIAGATISELHERVQAIELGGWDIPLLTKLAITKRVVELTMQNNNAGMTLKGLTAVMDVIWPVRAKSAPAPNAWTVKTANFASICFSLASMVRS